MAITDSLHTPSQDHPFKISLGNVDGKDVAMVSDGVCFSSFSFNTGSFLPIDNLNTPLPFEKNSKIYIEINMLRNLQPSGSATIKCTTVNNTNWPTYPELFDINPKDEYDATGRVIKLVDGKTQTKCYVLIGYGMNDTLKNGPDPKNSNNNEEGGSEESSEEEEDSSSEDAKGVVQILKHNFILLASVVSGVPVVFPAPFFDGLVHQQACNDFKTS